MIGMETTALRDRLMDGLDRFASAMRAEVRRSVAPRGLNPAQDAILRMLMARPAGLRVRVLASPLGVRQPTVTGSVIALERRVGESVDKPIRRMPAPPSSRSRRRLSRNQLLPFPRLRPPLWRIRANEEQASLLNTLIKLIRSLQLRHAIPPQRICVTCKYFRPNVHSEAAEPHHCVFVDGPFGNRVLRLDCPEHGHVRVLSKWRATGTLS